MLGFIPLLFLLFRNEFANVKSLIEGYKPDQTFLQRYCRNTHLSIIIPFSKKKAT
jgi:hypothetical protein